MVWWFGGLVVWSIGIPPVSFLVASYYFEGPQVIIISSLVNIELSAKSALLYLALMAGIVGYSLSAYLLGPYPLAQWRY